MELPVFQFAPTASCHKPNQSLRKLYVHVKKSHEFFLRIHIKGYEIPNLLCSLWIWFQSTFIFCWGGEILIFFYNQNSGKNYSFSPINLTHFKNPLKNPLCTLALSIHSVKYKGSSTYLESVFKNWKPTLFLPKISALRMSHKVLTPSNRFTLHDPCACRIKKAKKQTNPPPPLCCCYGQ